MQRGKGRFYFRNPENADSRNKRTARVSFLDFVCLKALGGEIEFFQAILRRSAAESSENHPDPTKVGQESDFV